LVLDSLTPFLIKKAILKVKKTKKGKTALLFISKSGKTFETTANFFAILKIIKKYQPKIFIISDRNSPLWNFGQKNKFLTFEIPEKVVGRYSVFSNVGLVPLFLAGVNIKRLLVGAKKANQICLVDNPLKNPALSSALTIFYHYQKGKNIYSNLVFPPDLEYFGKWYVQLMGESLGKDGKGITPTVTTGTTDFHAIGQLYFDGPRDKLINFVFVENLGLDFEIGNLEEFSQIFPGMKKKRVWQLNRAIFEGVKMAYLKKKLPFTETILEKLDEEDLGFLFRMKMIEIVILANLMKVNAFDQPGVELYKIETRRILQK
jgi:glucose-6-phosphate isomerase